MCVWTTLTCCCVSLSSFLRVCVVKKEQNKNISSERNFDQQRRPWLWTRSVCVVCIAKSIVCVSLIAFLSLCLCCVLCVCSKYVHQFSRLLDYVTGRHKCWCVCVCVEVDGKVYGKSYYPTCLIEREVHLLWGQSVVLVCVCWRPVVKAHTHTPCLVDAKIITNNNNNNNDDNHVFYEQQLTVLRACDEECIWQYIQTCPRPARGIHSDRYNRHKN